MKWERKWSGGSEEVGGVARKTFLDSQRECVCVLDILPPQNVGRAVGEVHTLLKRKG